MSSNKTDNETGTVNHGVFTDNKTPKMLVNEMCAKWKVKPKYEYPPSSPSKSSTNYFQCVLSVPKYGDENLTIKGEGSGGSKKEAEQRAAWDILPHIMTYEELFELTAAGKMMKQMKLEKQKITAPGKKPFPMDIDPVSDTDDGEITGEPIGELKTLCERQKTKLEMPKYEESEQKSPTGNIFTITCSVGSISTQVGRRLTKKEAKRLSSYRVLKDLKEKGYEIEKKKGSPKPSSPSKTSECKKSQRLKDEEVSSSMATEVGKSTATDTSQRPSGITLLDQYTSADNDDDEVPMKTEDNDLDPLSLDNESDEDSEDPMDVDTKSIITDLKRKFHLESDAIPSKKCSYEQLILNQLSCSLPGNTCLKFVANFSHFFLHLPTIPALQKPDFEEDQQIASQRVFKQVATELKLKYSFSKEILCRSKKSMEENCPAPKYVIFLKIFFPHEFQRKFQKIHSLHGSGESIDEAKTNTCIAALDYIKQMKLTDNSEQ